MDMVTGAPAPPSRDFISGTPVTLSYVMPPDTTGLHDTTHSTPITATSGFNDWRLLLEKDLLLYCRDMASLGYSAWGLSSPDTRVTHQAQKYAPAQLAQSLKISQSNQNHIVLEQSS
jgi:hypothetical protein